MNPLHLVLDHLWQSTVVVLVVALAAWALRGRRAGLRYALWFAASVKFVVPFAALTAIGAAIGSRWAGRIPRPAPEFLDDIVRAPFAMSAAASSPLSAGSVTALPSISTGAIFIALWAAGCALVVAVWAVRWIRAARAVHAAELVESGREVAILRRLEASLGRRRPMAVRVSDATIEPGVFGILRPALLWPRSMSDHLSDDQIETILLHEISHVRRFDNLTALCHLAVQAVCWFHPLVWWIGSKLIDERERACDEDVVRTGRDRRVYAESILKTCQFCVGSPVTSMAGVTGSDLKRRVATIMAAPVGTGLGAFARVAVAIACAAVIAVPIVNGAAGVPQMTDTGLALPNPAHVFEAGQVRQNKSGDRSAQGRSGNDHVTIRNYSLKLLLTQAFGVQEAQIIGGPDWLSTDRFDIVAKAETGTPDPALKELLQNLMIDRFALKLRIETRNMPIYAMVLARADGTLGPDLVPAGCEKYTTGEGCGSSARLGAGLPPLPARAGGAPGGAMDTIVEGSGRGAGGGGGGAFRSGGPGGASMSAQGLTMAALARMLTGAAGRIVVDRTNLPGRFEMRLRFSPPGRASSDDPNDSAPSLFTAVQEQLGLKLEATRGPVEVLVIDSAQRPVNDDFVIPEDPAR